MTTHKNTAEMSLVPAARSVPLVAGDTPAMREWAEQLVARARAEGVELTGDDGLVDRDGPPGLADRPGGRARGSSRLRTARPGRTRFGELAQRQLIRRR